MTTKPVIQRTRANRDVDEAIEYYLRETNAATAQAFIATLEVAYVHIGRHPASGSSRYADVLDIPGLRCWALRRFPYLVFYIELPGQIDVWRVLHAARNIPSWLREPN